MLCGIGGMVGIAVGTGGSVVLRHFVADHSLPPGVDDGGGIYAVRGAGGFVRHLPCGKGVRLQPVEADCGRQICIRRD